MLFRPITATSVILAALITASAEPLAQADGPLFDATPAWPLCGRIAENPPEDWTPDQGCPASRWGNPDHSDLAILHTTFGPRQLATEGDRYDYHRGLDLATSIGTPMFAIADGIVRIAGPDPSYEDPVISIRHFRPDGSTSCSPDGCYHSLYLHVSSWLVAEDDTVVKGQLIGFTGASASGFEHLHFEIRDAVPEDPSSSWQRDAIHPLRVLPYHLPPGNTQVSIVAVNTSSPRQPKVTVRVTQPAVTRTLDVGRVAVEVYDRRTMTPVFQSGSVANSNGYHVNPPWFDMEQHNREYTHKNSSAFPWSSFSNCPYASQHGSSYSASVHVDRQDPQNYQAGLFNGLRISTNRFNNPATSYELTVEFIKLTGLKRASDLCFVASAYSVHGVLVGSASSNCP